jgi:Na+/H+ antiporter NhaD/arsenite permease-like protein
MNRATIALVGSSFLIALGVLNVQEAWQAIDPSTIIFLLSMMVVNANLSYAVLLLAPLISRDDPRSWLLLAASSTLAGNLTLFGAVANLITVEAAAKLGYKLSFWEHLRFGLPLTMLTLMLAYLWVH